MRARWIIGWILRGLCLWFLLAWVMPFPEEVLEAHPQNTRYLDREGGLLRRTLGAEGVDADWIPLSQSGDWAGSALIAVEDQRFYRHFGVDPVAVLRAVGQNLMHLGVVSGASTISTQVIRMTEPRPRHLGTKIIEAFRATQLELRHDKDFILEQYLNRAPFGGNRQGIATAARRYYGKEAALLSAGEAALLMGLPQSPSRFRPDRAPDKAEKRRETVLRRMQEEGVISQPPLLEQGRLWVEPPLRAFHFTEWIRRRHGYLSGNLLTTLDPGLQQGCEAYLQSVRTKVRHAETDGVGVLLMDARSGEIRVWVSGWDSGNPKQSEVDAVTRKRAPGSTLKPFAFALAMERGWLTPSSRLPDMPGGYRDYRPENMNAQWSGEVSAQSALVQSLNLPALQVVERVGVTPFLGTLRTLGMDLGEAEAKEVGLGSVLGGGMDISLLELVQAYGVFARGGDFLSAAGLAGRQREEVKVFHPGVGYWISEMLSGAERDGMLFGHYGEVARPKIAFKTGTSHGLRDAWAIGWNADWVLGVWVGRMDGGTVNGLSGAGHAAPLLGELAERLLGPGSESWPEAPEGVVTWQGREIIAGLSQPEAEPAFPPRQTIVRPGPDARYQMLTAAPMQLPLQVWGKPGEKVHWFVNGRWIGEQAVGEPLLHPFSAGVYEIRAVFADGTTDRRELRIE